MENNARHVNTATQGVKLEDSERCERSIKEETEANNECEEERL